MVGLTLGLMLALSQARPAGAADHAAPAAAHTPAAATAAKKPAAASSDAKAIGEQVKEAVEAGGDPKKKNRRWSSTARKRNTSPMPATAKAAEAGPW